jgi:hypothetical protein
VAVSGEQKMKTCFDETEELRRGAVQQGVAVCVRKRGDGKVFGDQTARKKYNVKYFSGRDFRRGDEGSS